MHDASLFSSQPILTAAEMRACDTHTMTMGGVPSQVLMERAARAVAQYLLDRVDLFPAGPVVVLCGSGNNGGDGLAAARFLASGAMKGTREVRVIYVGRCNEAGEPDEARMSVECARQYRLAQAAGMKIATSASLADALHGATAVVDAIFGIGLDRPIAGAMAEVLQMIIASGLSVLAVDIPSGVNADTGLVMGLALPARATMTMQALKAGLLLYPGAELCGEIAVAEIGVTLAAAEPRLHMADEALLRRVLEPRTRRSHKGTYGRVLLLCGSVGMSGAAVLCARAALRSGAGLVEVLTPEENRMVLQAAVPEAIVSAYAASPLIGQSDAERHAALRETVRRAVANADAVVAGCGLGRSDMSRAALDMLLSALPQNREIPLVLDADALNLLAEDGALWAKMPPERTQTVITPHPAEMVRLFNQLSVDRPGQACGCGRSVSEILAHLLDCAAEYAQKRGVTVVLKDAHTVVASPDGACRICTAGNAGMATGGSGDALAGIMGALLSQVRMRLGGTVSMAEAVGAAVYLHAAAGDMAAERLGECGLLPSDLIDTLPLVTQNFSNSRTRVEWMGD